MALHKTEKDLELDLAYCKGALAKILEISDGTTAENEIEWIRKVLTCYNDAIGRIETLVATLEEKNAKKNYSLHLEKVKMPFFDGTVRQYPQFKMDFQKQVMPSLSETEMLKRLDEKYGDPAKLFDTIMNTIQSKRTIREGENKRFIELANIVEDGYKDLERLGLEKEITTTSSVNIYFRLK